MPSQWIQLMAFALEFKPDFILELGRGDGNSTCAFTEVCRMLLPSPCAILSLCLSDDWDKKTVPRLKNVVTPEWFAPLTALTTDILQFDYTNALAGKKRILLFWDAHGYDIAEVVLGHILPLIKEKEHLVVMHDLSDSRFIGAEQRSYGDNGIWKGKNTWDGPRFRIGPVDSCVEQAVAALDFCTRNDIPLHSSDESFHQELTDDQWKGLVEAMGSDHLSRNGHWFWFSLKEAGAELTFPRPVARERGYPDREVTPDAVSQHGKKESYEIPFTITLFSQAGGGLIEAWRKISTGKGNNPALPPKEIGTGFTLPTREITLRPVSWICCRLSIPAGNW